jgi:hypothetical protein
VFRLALFVLCPVLVAGCSGSGESGDASLLSCELAEQCFTSDRSGGFDYDLDEFRSWCECADTPSPSCSGNGGSFHTGACEGDAIARCDSSEGRSRTFYDGFAGYSYRTHADVQMLANACSSVDGGSLVLLKPELCSTNSDCDDGVVDNGQEQCVQEQECSDGFCTEKVCKPAG